MAEYATRLANGQDSLERMRHADSLRMFPAGNPGLARGGLRRDGGGVVAVTAGTMNVTVSPFAAWIDGGSSDAQGGYTFVLDATKTLTLAPGDASQARTDVIVARVRDNTYDASGSTDASVVVVQGTPGAGTPALPTTCVPLRQITVPAGASAGTGGLSSGNLGADLRTYTTGLGGVLTVASQAERDALPTTTGQVVYRTDTDQLEVRLANGWHAVNNADTAWSAPTFANGWANFGGANLIAGYRKVGDRVELRGMVKSGTIGAAMFTLPAGYRPPANQFFAVASNNAFGMLEVDSTGIVTAGIGSNAWVSLSGVSFSIN